MFFRYSSFNKLVRIVARIMRWRKTHTQERPLSSTELTLEEIQAAEIRIVRVIQIHNFPELRLLQNGRCFQKESHLLSFNPIVCPERSVLVTGGRISLSDLPKETRQTIILPNKDPIVALVVQSVHERHAHAPQETTLVILRSRYHIIHGRYGKFSNGVWCVNNRKPIHVNKEWDFVKGEGVNIPGIYSCGT